MHYLIFKYKQIVIHEVYRSINFDYIKLDKISVKYIIDFLCKNFV